MRLPLLRRVVSIVCLLVPMAIAASDEAPAWEAVRELVSGIAAPPSVRADPALARIGFEQPPEAMRGFVRDLNGDGEPEIFVESARDLCGQAGCAYALFDGKSHRFLGEMGGNLLRRDSLRFNGWSVLEWSSHVDADTAAYAAFAYTGDAYAPVSHLEIEASRTTFPGR